MHCWPWDIENWNLYNRSHIVRFPHFILGKIMVDCMLIFMLCYVDLYLFLLEQILENVEINVS
jgi:hypothetical protein